MWKCDSSCLIFYLKCRSEQHQDKDIYDKVLAMLNAEDFQLQRKHRSLFHSAKHEVEKDRQKSIYQSTELEIKWVYDKIPLGRVWVQNKIFVNSIAFNQSSCISLQSLVRGGPKQ